MSPTCPQNMVNFGPLTAESLRSVGEFGAPLQISTSFASSPRYCTDVAQRRSSKRCTMFGRLLGWYTIYIFGGSCPLTEFCQVQSSVCVQVLHSPILAALLHATRAVVVSQFAAWYKEWNYRTFAESATYIRQGGHHIGHRPTF